MLGSLAGSGATTVGTGASLRNASPNSVLTPLIVFLSRIEPAGARDPDRAVPRAALRRDDCRGAGVVPGRVRAASRDRRTGITAAGADPRRACYALGWRLRSGSAMDICD